MLSAEKKNKTKETVSILLVSLLKVGVTNSSEPDEINMISI